MAATTIPLDTPPTIPLSPPPTIPHDEPNMDGGSGWIVVTSCALITFWFVGVTYSWGVFQASLVESRLSTASTLSFVGSSTVACVAVFAVLNARLLNIMGARAMGMSGILLLGLGEILSGFTVHNLLGLFVTAGFTMGIGASFCFMAVSVIPAQYFQRKRGLANGIVFAGGGLGGAVISIAAEQLIRRLGTAWAFRITGLLTLATGLPAAWLLREQSPRRRTTFIDWRLFRNPKFTLLFLAGSIAMFPLFVPPFFLPLYAQSLSLSSSTGAALVAGFNFSSAIGRITMGLLCDKLGPINTLFLSLLVSGLSMLLMWPFRGGLGLLLAFAIINGFGNGGFFSTMPTVVGNVFGSERVALAFGMIVTGWSGGYLAGGPNCGILAQRVWW